MKLFTSKSLIGLLSLIIILTLAGCNPVQPKTQPESSVQTPNQTSNITQDITSPYKDGIYTVDGVYNTPAGEERIGVTITLNTGIIQDVAVVQKAISPVSQKMQTDFADHFKPEVLGKNIDEIQLSKVSGSSLTPKGFNNALEVIKAQAKT